MTRHEKEFEELEAAIAAIRSKPIPEGPAYEFRASVLDAMQAKWSLLDAAATKQSKSSLVENDSLITRRKKMFRFAKYGSFGTIATVAIVLIVTGILGGLGSRPAFAEMLAKVRQASSVTYKMSQKMGNGPNIEFQCSVQGTRMRMEIPSQMILLVDTEKRKSVALTPAMKTAVAGDMPGESTAGAMNLAQVLSEVTNEDHKLQGTEEWQGRETDVFQLSKLPEFLGRGPLGEDDSFKIWVDRETTLPVRVTVDLQQDLPQGGTSSIHMEMQEFVWNVELAPELFDMEIPEGYSVQTVNTPQ